MDMIARRIVGCGAVGTTLEPHGRPARTSQSAPGLGVGQVEGGAPSSAPAPPRCRGATPRHRDPGEKPTSQYPNQATQTKQPQPQQSPTSPIR